MAYPTRSAPSAGGIFGLLNGGNSGMLDEYLSPEMKRQQGMQGLMGLAQGLLAASGPSRTPVSFGQALGQGMQGMQEAQGNQEERILKHLQVKALLKKANELDVDKLGEMAFMKAAQGMNLTPQEKAALHYIDSKSPTSSFNPVTGALERKPSLLERAGLGGGTMPQSAGVPATTSGYAAPPRTAPGGQATQPSPVVEDPSEWDIAFEQQLKAAEGNPRLQQSLKENYAKAKISMSEPEAKASGFADRMLQSNPIIDEKKGAGMNLWEKTKGDIPYLGNYIVSGDYQSFNQAQRDFINAQLRRESGAVISPAEFENAEKQYFPKPGDTDSVVKQKAANRDAAVKAMQRSAGPAYKPLKVTTPGGGRGASGRYDLTTPSGLKYRVVK